MELKGSKTEKNLLASFAGESMARNRYTFFSEVAKKEGYEQIAALLIETAENEKAHAKVIFKFLNSMGKTEDNLAAAAFGEHEEWSVIYKEAEKVANEEGFTEIAEFFKYVTTVEFDHEKRFLELKENVKNQTVFKEDTEVEWKCRNCGYTHKGTEAEKVCPLCKHPMAYFEIKNENY